MKVHAFIITWNGVEPLSQLIQSLIKNVNNIDVEYYIRDNASTDSTQSYLNSLVFPHHYYKMPHNNDNFAKCNNFLFEQANIGDDDYIWFLNNDITINDSNSLANMIALMKDDVGIVGAKLLYPNKTIQHGGVVFDKKNNGLPFHYCVGKKDSAYISKNREFSAVTFACALMKAKCYRSLKNGKLDEKYNWCFDDISACLDVKFRQHKKILYCGQTDITHHESYSLKKNGINKMFMNQNFRLFREEWLDHIVYDC